MNLSSGAWWDVVAAARLWPDVAIGEARVLIRGLQEKKAEATPGDVTIYDIDPAIAIIAAVDAPAVRSQLIGQLASAKLPGVNTQLLKSEIERVRLENREQPHRGARAR
jgi:hypothetical protein